jgi:type IV pilus assembly protein PilF
MRQVLVAWFAVAVLCACNAPGPSAVSAGLDNQPLDPQSDPTVITDVGAPRDRARAHTNLAAAYYELGNVGVALEEIRVALAADPGYAAAHNVLGLIHMDLKENTEAESSFQRALRLAPNDPDANHNFGVFLCQTGREAQGVRYLLTAVRNPLYATPEKSYTQAGLCALRRKDDEEAMTNLERALKLQPNYLAAMLPLAQIRYRRGELDEARSIVVQFNRLVEPNSESLWLALRIERRLGDRAAETGYAEQLRRRFPASREYQSLQKGVYE